MLYVITNNKIEGFHEWTNAPEEVSFLRNQHRHIFEIICYFRVYHDNREIEIFLQQWEIEQYLYNKYGNPCRFGGKSCEAIARELLNYFGADRVKVLEDGQGGAIIYRGTAS